MPSRTLKKGYNQIKCIETTDEITLLIKKVKTVTARTDFHHPEINLIVMRQFLRLYLINENPS